MKFRVLLADDHAMFRNALRMALEMAPDVEIVAEAADGRSVLKLFGESRPDVVCMDVNMPGLNGVDATRQLLALHPDVRIVGLSCDAEPRLVAEMIAAGALGYVVKMNAGRDLLPAIRRVSQNQTYLSPELESLGIAGMASHIRFTATPCK